MPETTPLRNLQLKEVEILKAFADFCEQHGLRYYLAEGTLLGAIRHQGFIPWDDDTDVMMPRKDYDRLIELGKNGLPGGYELRNYKLHSESLGLPIKVVCTKYLLKRHLFGKVEIVPVWIDVFPLDGLPNAPRNQQKHLKKLHRAYFLHRLSRVQYHGTEAPKSGVRQLVLKADHILHFSKILNFRKQTEKVESLLKQHDYDKSDCCINYYSEYRKRQIFPKSYYGSGKLCKFEGYEFKIPAEAEKILSGIYGDYMKLPPEEQRVCKHSIEIIENKKEE
ncbi:MAG: LicD family protein [Oscillospiraceae bacterium]|jgi:lipopolysaccharide cholinephosphotransferase